MGYDTHKEEIELKNKRAEERARERTLWAQLFKAGWRKFQSKRGKGAYYQDPKTKKTTCERPTSLKHADEISNKLLLIADALKMGKTLSAKEIERAAAAERHNLMQRNDIVKLPVQPVPSKTNTLPVLTSMRLKKHGPQRARKPIRRVKPHDG